MRDIYPNPNATEPQQWMEQVSRLRVQDVQEINQISGQQSFRGSFRPAIKTKTTDYAVGFGDFGIIGDTTGGDVTITLPDVASFANYTFFFKKKVAANNLTIDGDGATIDGAATVVLAAQYDSITIISDGTEWWIISQI